mmetsp:Transcript_37046/g.95667  ORF Transcript_37046/g.95667 Transcript_37046/m.95667 type:complete len:258 (-) Transcript_37046:283-1056(-)
MSLSRHGSGNRLRFVNTWSRLFAQLKLPSRTFRLHVLVTKPCNTSGKASAPLMPTAKKTMMQMVVEVQRLLLTLTPGLFSLTHEGTVVTKPKLNRIVPSTAACEPVLGSVFTAGNGSQSLSERLAAIQISQQQMVRPKATVWMLMLSSRFHRPQGSAKAAAVTKPMVSTMWHPQAFPPSKSFVLMQEMTSIDPGNDLVPPYGLVFSNGVRLMAQVRPKIAAIALSTTWAERTTEMMFKDWRDPISPHRAAITQCLPK